MIATILLTLTIAPLLIIAGIAALVVASLIVLIVEAIARDVVEPFIDHHPIVVLGPVAFIVLVFSLKLATMVLA